MRHNPGDAEAAAWHDDLIYALHLRAPSPAHDDWRSEIALDIDHIVEWVCGVDGRMRFRVAPASLVFHDVSDLRIGLDFGGQCLPAVHRYCWTSSGCPWPGVRT